MMTTTMTMNGIAEMAGGEADSCPAPVDPQLVGNSFVEQFYKFLHQFPEHVHRFYQDSSFMTRPAPDGLTTTVTTMKGISDQILTMEYQNYQTEIITVDSQMSYYNGVTVLVSGYLTGKDLEKRKFAQSFFLAPQEKGYFVLNDVFRYVDEKESALAMATAAAAAAAAAADAANNITEEVAATAVDETPVPAESSPVADESTPQVPDEAISMNNNTTTSSSAEDTAALTVNITNKEVNTSTDTSALQHGGSAPTPHQQIVDIQSDQQKPPDALNQNQNENIIQTHNESHVPSADVIANSQNQTAYNVTVEVDSSEAIQDAGSRKSFASIVHALKDNSAPFQIKIPPKPVEPPRSAKAASTSNPLKKNNENQNKGNSIFVANLPMDVTLEQVREVFVKFGPIKPDGIKIRNNQLRLNCFGFVDFVTPAAMQSAIKASPIMIGTRKAYIEERKGTDPVKPSPSIMTRPSQQQQKLAYVNTSSMAGYQNDPVLGRSSSIGRNSGARSRVNSPRVRPNSEGGRVGRQAQAAAK